MDSTKLRLGKFVFDEDLWVHRHPEHGDFSYSDGQAVEERLLQTLTAAADVSTGSRELVAKITDWPSEYHFAPQRHNLLRHLGGLAGARALELGAGCGAITRFLGERGAMVTAVEGSLLRARCARQRCRDLDNVDVYCSDYQSIEFEPEYDLATLIGVLEYSPAHFKSQQPLLECLAMARGALTENGRLVIAIENQLGLKYFCGRSEDHLARPFVGLEDLYSPTSARTVGRAELERLLRQAGFTSVTFQYPFPDYKLPRFLMTEDAFTCPGFAPWEIIRQLDSRDYSGRRTELIDERSVWPVIGRNGLVPDLANSFLVIASCAPSAQRTPDGPTLLVAGYTSDRAAPHNVVTTFWSEGGRVSVMKEPMAIADTARGTPNHCPATLVHRLGREAYVPGRHFESELRKAIRTDDLDAYVNGLQAWLHFVYREGVIELDPREPSRSLLRPDFIDCLPRNLIVGKTGLTLIDREWEYHGRFSVAVLLLRHFDLIHDDPTFLTFLCRHFPKRRDVLLALLERAGIQIDDTAVRDFVEVYNEIRSVVFPWGVPLTAPTVNRWLRVRQLPRKRSFVERALRKGLGILRSGAHRARRFLRHGGPIQAGRARSTIR